MLKTQGWPKETVIIPEPQGQTVLLNAIRHIRRMHMNCKSWTLPQGDEGAVNLMLNLYYGYLTGFEAN